MKKNSSNEYTWLITLVIGFFVCGNINAESDATQSRVVDLVIFSFDRPMQLYALLESAQRYIQGIHKSYIIYRTSDDSYAQGYNHVRESFPDLTFFQQGENPQQDFKPLVLRALFKSSCPYVMFAVDDIVVKDYINLNECAHHLESSNAYGFFLRLGANLTDCYSHQAKQHVPPLRQIGPDIYMWTLGQGQYDWGYPHTVDMTLYRKSDIRQDLMSMHYAAPNSLEASWAARSRCIMTRCGLCFSRSKIVNIPINRVQHEFDNRTMNSYSSGELLNMFFNNMKIDIMSFFKIDNKAAHAEYMLTFTAR